MFDLCPPFQIDGNLGGPAAMTEMLVQSTDTQILVLPALPSQWPTGSFSGVRVRGGGRVDLKWNDGELTELRLTADHAVRYRVVYGSLSASVTIHPGKPAALDNALHVARQGSQ